MLIMAAIIDEQSMSLKAGIKTPKQLIKYLMKMGLTEKQAYSQLNMGIKIEHEHSLDDKISTRIAMDHLVEFSLYYTALKQMEKELAKQNKARYGKALGLSIASIAAGSIAKGSQPGLGRGIARGIQAGTAVGAIGALFEEPKKPKEKSTTTTTITKKEVQKPTIMNGFSGVNPGKEFIAFMYGIYGEPIQNTWESKYVAFIPIEQDFTFSFAAQLIKDEIKGNWIRDDNPHHDAIKHMEQGTSPTNLKKIKWFKRVETTNKGKKGKKNKTNPTRKLYRTSGGTVGYIIETQGKPGHYRHLLETETGRRVWVHGRLYEVKENKAESAQQYYIENIPGGLLFNMEDLRATLDKHGFRFIDYEFKSETDKKIHEINVIVEPIDIPALKKVEKEIDTYLKDNPVQEGGKRSIIVQATPKGTLLFLIEDGIARVFEGEPDDIEGL